METRKLLLLRWGKISGSFQVRSHYTPTLSYSSPDFLKMKTRWPLTICLLGCLLFSEASACLYNVRDLGFVDIAPAVYHLYCYTRDDTPEEHISAFEQAAYATFAESNVEVEMIEVDRQQDHPAMEYLYFWEIQSFPAAVLVSPQGRSLILPISSPEKPFRETVSAALESVVSSPKREEMVAHIVKAYGVVLLIEGEDRAENKRARQAVAGAIESIARTMGQLPKRIEEPPFTMVISREALAQERIFHWSLDVHEQDLGEPHVAVLYGKGRRLGPLLRGERITQANLLDILSVVGLSCECGLDRSWITGIPLPLKWEEKTRSEAVRFLGFDPESPMVKMEMSRILSTCPSPAAEAKEGIDAPGDRLDQYSEGAVGRESEIPATRISPAQFRQLVSPGPAAPDAGGYLHKILVVVSILALLVLAGGAFILWRAQRMP